MKKSLLFSFTMLFAIVFVGATSNSYAQCGSSPNPNNTCTGAFSGINIATGTNNSFHGSSSGQNATGGDFNSMFGAMSGFNSVMGTRNSYFGGQSGFNTIGSRNSFFGMQSGLNNTTGSFNSFFGDASGINNIAGSYNSGLGRGSDVAMDGLTFATAIGAGAMVSASNTVQIGRAGFDKVRIGMLGTGGTTMVCLNADNEFAACPGTCCSVGSNRKCRIEENHRTSARRNRSPSQHGLWYEPESFCM